MKLSEIITDYRKRMGISQREFSRRCHLSNSYISFLENGYNPKTGEPIIPSIPKLKQIASGMNMTLHDLAGVLDEDFIVDLKDDNSVFSEPIQVADPFSPEERQLISAWRSADESIKSAVRKLLDISQ